MIFALVPFNSLANKRLSNLSAPKGLLDGTEEVEKETKKPGKFKHVQLCLLDLSALDDSLEELEVGDVARVSKHCCLVDSDHTLEVRVPGHKLQS